MRPASKTDEIYIISNLIAVFCHLVKLHLSFTVLSSFFLVFEIDFKADKNILIMYTV